ncbi:MAG TPA: PepSY-associated TM helix domain-containing protein [Bryobacterales bacterium]|nr:PepSY-associated TM helix domain-containing protein [Bryobacterales bacterium]
MKLFRKIIFWLHLCAGVFAGVVVLIMSVTGVTLTYEKQMLEWADLRGYRSAAAGAGGSHAERLPISALLARVQAQRGALPSSIIVRPDPADPVAFPYGREAPLYVDPYTGAVLGQGATGLRSFFRFITDWHRWLGTSEENRAVGRSITGACNLAFLFIVVSGIYLWWPATLRWPNVKAIILFRGGLSGKARDFNWHNVIGFWSMLSLFFVILGATVVSYPWASDLVYRSLGEDPPARPVPAGPAGGGSAPAAAPSDEVSLDGVDELFARAGEIAPGWKRITLTMPKSNEAPLTFAIDEGSGGQPQLRSTLTLDRATGSVVRWEKFSDATPGRRLRTWLRFIHTGEAGGIAGQTLAGVVSFGAIFLVYTGFALTLRRFTAWVRRRRGRVEELSS